MNKELVEKFQVKYGWTDKAILSISREDVLTKMSREEFDIYLNRMKKIAPKNDKQIISYYDVKDGVVVVPQGDEWNG